MPIAHFHLVDGSFTAEQGRRLLTEACRSYAESLESPVDRVRAFIVRYAPEDAATGGVIVAESGLSAPYFTAIMLAGRPREQQTKVAARFTELLVDVLGVDRSTVRGQIVVADPATWFIAGSPAAEARADEIAARASDG